MAGLPSGTVTFLFTDLEGSTRLWEQHPEAMRDALARHDEILHSAVEDHDGHVVKTTGDGLHAAFATAHAAVDAAVGAQRALTAEEWATPMALRVRMGVHTGEADVRDGDYYGPAVNRAARVASAAHGGQIVASASTVELVQDSLADDVDLVDLGQHRLRDLGRPEHVFQIVGKGLERDFDAIRSLDAFPGNLRADPTSFIGRGRDLAAIAELLASSRVVTLTGVGGAGKTRLALQAAAQLLPYREHGAWFVELAPASTDDALPDLVGSTLGILPRAGQTMAESVIDFLSVKDLLLVLDNCEHVLRPASELVADIVDAAPRVTVLATSREGLGVLGEHLWPVVSLGLPRDGVDADAAASTEAVQLFTERARAVRPDFAVTHGNVDAVVEICRRLDGIPLALELAAARIGALAPADIAARLDERFRLLAGGKRVVVERHQTLRSAVEWSYDLLDTRAQRVFERLSVFAGGFALDAAEAVAADDEITDLDVLDLLDELVAKSMVVADERDDRRRYRLLETLRQYGRERLDERGDGDRVRRLHAEHYATVVDQADRRWMGPEDAVWLRVLDDEFENLRAAVVWSVDAEATDLAVRLTAPIDLLANLDSGWRYGSLPHLALRAPDAASHPLYPKVCAGAAFWLAFIGDVERARALAEEGFRVGEQSDARTAIWAPVARMLIATSTGSADEALTWLARAQSVATDADAGTKVILGVYEAIVRRRWGGEPVEATLPVAEAALEGARRLGWPFGMAFAHYGCGAVIGDADPPRAIEHLDESARLTEATATVHYLARNTLMRLHAQRGAADEAMRNLRLVLTKWVDINLRYNVGWCLAVAAWTFATLDEPTVAATLGGIVDAEVAAPRIRSGADHDRLLAALETARDVLGDDGYERLHARGASMTYDEAVDFTLTEAARVEAEASE